jgi:serine/threonine-protein phosphatase CPPED1
MMLKRISLVLALAGCLAAQNFIQMTDPQFGVLTNNQSFVQETANFEFAIATANRLKPAFVVVTGDLSHRAHDSAEIAEYKRITAKLDPSIKLYALPGNHDETVPPSAESLAKYRETFGPNYYTFRVGDIAGFALDSNLEKDEKTLPEESAKMQAWLRIELEKAHRDGVKNLMVFQHHPLFTTAADEADNPNNLPKEVRQRYLALFHEFGVKYILVGHTHKNAEARDGDIQQLTTGPISRPTQSQSGMRIVKVTPEGVTQRNYDFGELP